MKKNFQRSSVRKKIHLSLLLILFPFFFCYYVIRISQVISHHVKSILDRFQLFCLLKISFSLTPDASQISRCFCFPLFLYTWAALGNWINLFEVFLAFSFRCEYWWKFNGVVNVTYLCSFSIHEKSLTIEKVELYLIVTS